MMDRTDKEIIRLLQSDGRMSHEQISKDIHLSRPAVHERIRRLEAEGIIRGYSVDVDWETLGLSLGAFLFVRVAGKTVAHAQEILKLGSPEAIIQECHRIAGDWCLLVQIRATSPSTLQVLLDEIRSIPGVTGTMTTISLSTVRPEEAAGEPASDTTSLTRRN